MDRKVDGEKICHTRTQHVCVCVLPIIYKHTRGYTHTYTTHTHTRTHAHTHTHTHTNAERQGSTQKPPKNVNQSVVEVCICVCRLRLCALRSNACLHVFKGLPKDRESDNALTSWTYPPITGHEVEAVRHQCLKLLFTGACMRRWCMPGC